jgi:hypothetical protein
MFMQYVPYIILLVLLTVSCIVELLNVKGYQKNAVRIIVMTILTLFIGLRFHTGADWGLYINYFYKFAEIGNKTSWEIGYCILSKIIYYLFGNYYILQFLATFLFIYSLNKFYSQNTEYPILAFTIFVFIYFISLFMAQVRQSIALSIVLLSTNYIFKKDFIKFSIMIVLACMFHISAIVAISLYFLNVKWSKSVSLLIILISQIFYFFPDIVLKSLDIVVPFMPERIGHLAQSYLNSLFAKKAQFNTGLFYIGTVLISSASVLLPDEKDEKYCFFSNSLVVAVFIMAMSNAMMILARFQSYFYVYGIVCIANLLNIKIKNIQSNSFRLILVMSLILFFSYRSISVIINNNISKITQRAENYALVPYYNLISHPEEAKERLDWYQRNISRGSIK